jgi:hypothetical protein
VIHTKKEGEEEGDLTKKESRGKSNLTWHRLQSNDSIFLLLRTSKSRAGFCA